MSRVAADLARVIAERDELREQVARVEALCDRWDHGPGHYCCEKCQPRRSPPYGRCHMTARWRRRLERRPT